MPSLGKESALRIAWIVLLTILSASVLVSCGGGPSDAEPAAGQEDSHGHSHDAVAAGDEPQPMRSASALVESYSVSASAHRVTQFSSPV